MEVEVVVELGVIAVLAAGGALGWEVESAAVELPEGAALGWTVEPVAVEVAEDGARIDWALESED